MTKDDRTREGSTRQGAGAAEAQTVDTILVNPRATTSIDPTVAAQLLASSTDCVAVLTLGGAICWLNDSGRSLLEIEDDKSLTGRPWVDLWQDEHRELMEAAVSGAANGVLARFYAYCSTTSGMPKFWDVVVSPVRSADGVPQQILAVARDITLQKSFEERVRSSEEQFRALADNIAQFAWMADHTGYIFWYNKRWFDYTGTTLEEMAGWGWRKVHHPEHVERVVEKIKWHFVNGEPWEDTFPLRAADGSYRWFLSRAMPIRDARDEVHLWCGTNTDITEQMEFADRLRQKARLIALSHEAILAWDFHGGIVLWNRGCEELYGHSRDEVLGLRTHEVLHTRHPIPTDEFEALLLKERSWSGELRHVAKDGSEIWVESRQELIDTGRGSIVLETNRDITERRKADELRRLLLAELDHRVKNTLAIVQAIASQTARRAVDLKSFGTSFTARLQALASAHNLLTATSWSGAELTNIVKSQLVDGSGSVRQIFIDGDAVFLPAQVSLQLSLILFELASNARKYGGLSRPDGRVSVSWRRADGERQQVRIMWKEAGGPPVVPPKSRGYGTTLIERAGAQPSLSVKIEFAPDGVACEILADIAHGSRDRQTYFNPMGRIAKPVPLSAPDGRNEHGHRARKRVLIVEDEPLIALEIEELLETHGYDPIGQAPTVGAALKAIARSEPDLAVVDANLVGEPVDGVLAALHSRNVPFVMVTGFARESLPKIVKAAGIPVVTKPIQAPALMAALTAVSSA